MFLGCSPCCGDDCPSDGRPRTDPADEGTWVPSGTWADEVSWTFESNPGDGSGDTWYFYGSSSTSKKDGVATTEEKSDWGNLCNWYSSKTGPPNSLTSPFELATRATRLPASGATVHIYSPVSTAAVGDVTVGKAYFWGTGVFTSSLRARLASGAISTTGTAHDSSGGVVFVDAENNGAVNNGATFARSSLNYGGTVHGGATFYDSSRNWINGVINDGATFNSNSINYATVNGGATFNGFGNRGIVNGGATFNPGSRHWAGTVNGGATFNNSLNESEVNGGATFNGNAANSDTVNDGATFNDTARSVGTVNGGATLNDDSFLSVGTVNGGATFNDRSYNRVDVSGGATFNQESRNEGRVYGVASFYGNSYNSAFAQLTGGATFNEASKNYGIVSVAATFNHDSRNEAAVEGVATFNDASQNGVTGYVRDNATFNDDACSLRLTQFGFYGVNNFDPVGPVCNGSAPGYAQVGPDSCGCG